MKRSTTRFALATLSAVGATLALTPAVIAAEAPTTPQANATTPQPQAQAPVQAPTALLGQFTIPADLRDYSDIGGLFGRTPFLVADGTVSWLWNRQLGPDDAKAIGIATASVDGTPAMTFGATGGTVALRRQYDAFPNPALSAAGGGTWIVDHPRTPRPARDQLIQLDDRQRASSRIKAPKDVTFQEAVATAKGVRIVGVERRRTGRRVTSFPVVVDGRRIVRQKFLTNVTSVAPLPDGSLLLVGQTASRTDLPDPVLRVTPGGRVMRMADRRRPDAAASTSLATPTTLGVAMLEGSRGGSELAASLKAAVVVRDARGQVVARKLVRDLAVPAPGTCQRPEALKTAVTLGTGPDGLPALRVSCRVEGQPFADQVTMLGLGRDLSVRWWRDAPESFRDGFDGSYRYVDHCGSDTVGADGRLLVIDCTGRVAAVTVPGAAVARGVASSKRRDGKTGAVIRITCRGPHGSVCSGVARVSVRGVVVGTAPYALPGRPGAAAASVKRHIATNRALPKRFTVALGS